jgi:heptosyltransferase-2
MFSRYGRVAGTLNKKKQLKLLVARIDRIGDVILSTPIPREIKRAYPNSFVAVLVKKYTKDVYVNNPYVDEIILYDEDNDGKPPSFWELVKTLRKIRFTHAFMLLPNERLNWLLFFSFIPNRIGVGHKLYQFLSFSEFVERKNYNPLRHEADFCLDMVRKIGIEPQTNEPEIYLSNEEITERDKLKTKLAPNGELIIGINTTSGKSSPNLTIDGYKKLLNLLVENTNTRIIVTDDNPPKEIVIKDVFYPNVGLSLRASIVNFSTLDVLISASTGPMHICAALKVPTISLFCPLIACSPKLWGPLGNESEIILPEENYCSNVCRGDPHVCDFSGQGGIDNEIVYKRVNSFIAKTLT